jgi:AcrR family transcriptional regulator
MSPRTVSQNEQIRQLKRKQIMDAALELFANVGYHPTSISEIAKKAGISKGLMYNYFDSKVELLLSILIEGYDRMIVSFDSNHDGLLSRDEMLLFVTDILEQIKSDPNYWKLYFSVMMQPTGNTVFHNELKEISAPFFEILIKYFESAGKHNPEAEALLFHSMLDGICINYLYHKNYPIKEIRQLIIERFV